jgi:hypothetical protein
MKNESMTAMRIEIESGPTPPPISHFATWFWIPLPLFPRTNDGRKAGTEEDAGFDSSGDEVCDGLCTTVNAMIRNIAAIMSWRAHIAWMDQC